MFKLCIGSLKNAQFLLLRLARVRSNLMKILWLSGFARAGLSLPSLLRYMARKPRRILTEAIDHLQPTVNTTNLITGAAIRAGEGHSTFAAMIVATSIAIQNSSKLSS